MRFYCTPFAGEPRIALANAAGDALLDLHGTDRRLPADPGEFIAAGAPALARARALLTEAPSASFVPLSQLVLRAPVPRPGKILCSGINYRSHLEENPSATLPTEPFFFAKMPSAVIGPGEPIRLPARSRQVDYEVEFAMVIGRRTESLTEETALDHVFGYTLLHDVSARDVQFKDNQITLGKNFDTFCPLGPCVVTPDELGDPAAIGLRTRLNGRLVQDGSTADWLFSLPRLLAALAEVMTLEPGDVVSTGTPAGVGLFRRPPVFLQAGDVVRLEADVIGTLENPVVSAQPKTVPQT